MGDTPAFDERVALLEEYVRRSGDTVVRSAVDDIVETEIGGASYSLTGHECRHGEHVYAVAGHPDLDYFTAYYFVNVLEDFAASLGATAEHDVDRETMTAIIDAVPADEMEQLKCTLFTAVSSTDYGTSLHTSGSGSLTAIELSQKLFPGFDDYGLVQFSKDIQALISGGSNGQTLLSRSLEVLVDPETIENSRLRVTDPL